MISQCEVMTKQRKKNERHAICLVDLENLCRGSEQVGQLSAMVHSWVKQVNRTLGHFTTIRNVVATGLNAIEINPSVKWHWYDAEFHIGHGVDGADRKLLDVLRTDTRLRRCDDVLIWSGDGCFSTPIRQLQDHGCLITVLSWKDAMSTELRDAADRCFEFQLPRRSRIRSNGANPVLGVIADQFYLAA